MMGLKGILVFTCAAMALYLTYKLLRTIYGAVAPRLVARGWFGLPAPPPPHTKPPPSPYVKSPKATPRRTRSGRNKNRTNCPSKLSPSPSSSSACPGTPGIHIRHSPAPASATPTRGILTPPKGTFDHSIARSRRAGLRVEFSDYVSIDADPALDKYPMKAPAPILKAALPLAIVAEILGGVSAKVNKRAERRRAKRTVAGGGVVVNPDGEGIENGTVAFKEDTVDDEGRVVWELWEGFKAVWREESDWESQLELWTAVVVASVGLKIVEEVVDKLGGGATCIVVVTVGLGFGMVGRN